MGGGARQFGVDAEQVPGLLENLAAAGLGFEGFHLYPGSQVLNGTLLAQTIERSCDLVLKLASHASARVQHVTLGGGWGIPYFSGDVPLDLVPVSEALAQAQLRLHQAFGAVTTSVELGRYLVGEAGVYVVRVLDRKLSQGEVFLVTDGGLHHHLAASGNFGQVIRRNYPVALANRMDHGELETVSVVGPLCTPLDLLAQAVVLPKAQPGDFVAIFQSGAYGASASPQAFLSHPACREVLV
jgi:diaminopimelate decarboxylase